MKKSSTFHFSFENVGKGLNGLFVKLFGSTSEKIAMDIISNMEIDAECHIELSPEEYKEFMDIDENILDREFDKLNDRTKKFVQATGNAAHDIIELVAKEYKHYSTLDDEISQFDDKLYEQKELRRKAKESKKD